jgi:hypothetical protein
MPVTPLKAQSSPRSSSQPFSGKGTLLKCGCYIVGDLVVESYCREGDRLFWKAYTSNQYQALNEHLKGNQNV